MTFLIGRNFFKGKQKALILKQLLKPNLCAILKNQYLVFLMDLILLKISTQSQAQEVWLGM